MFSQRQKKNKSGCDLMTKIHFQFWRPLLQDPQHLLVLSLEVQVLEKKQQIDY